MSEPIGIVATIRELEKRNAPDRDSEFLRITFNGVGFAFENSPIGASVQIQWQGRTIAGEVWSASYSPERGYYAIGIRSRNWITP